MSHAMASAMASVLTIGLVDEKTLRTLFRIPLPGYEGEDYGVPFSKTIPAGTASAWRLMDVVRLAGVSLGVLAFPSEFPSEKIPSSISWISAHTTPTDQIDRSPEWANETVEKWSGREIWLRIHGGNHSSEPVMKDQKELVEKLILRIAAVSDFKVLDSRHDLSKSFEAAHRKSAYTCELSGELLGTEIMHIVPFHMGSGVLSSIFQAVEEQGARVWAETAIQASLAAAPPIRTIAMWRYFKPPFPLTLVQSIPPGGSSTTPLT
ncbi:hypothetical protein B0H17DRAFT_388431 [Mycena rosella]|uniref:Uncharacterized protein n=1 Tax=Mycena rosella TaxID=1033263 RepID=A0AAD7CMZ1_MYCRO|nr:hypothetical protein B0H17DRAFT_388431 [Mycena rosella]